MTAAHHVLTELRMSHNFWSGHAEPYRGLEFIPTRETAEVLRSYRLIWRRNATGLVVYQALQEKPQPGVPVKPLIPLQPEVRLTFEMQIADPDFLYITRASDIPKDKNWYYLSNRNQYSNPPAMIPAADLLLHDGTDLLSVVRPVAGNAFFHSYEGAEIDEIRVEAPSGTVVQKIELSAPTIKLENQRISFESSERGLFKIKHYRNNAHRKTLLTYLSTGSLSPDTIGILELISDAQGEFEGVYQIPFANRQVRWQYNVTINSDLVDTPILLEEDVPANAAANILFTSVPNPARITQNQFDAGQNTITFTSNDVVALKTAPKKLTDKLKLKLSSGPANSRVVLIPHLPLPDLRAMAFASDGTTPVLESYISLAKN